MPRERRSGVRIAVLIAAGLLVVFVAGGVSTSRWSPAGRESRPAGPAPSVPAAPEVPAPSGATRFEALPDPDLRRPDDAPPALRREEIERRRAIAARIRARIEEGPREQPPGTFGGLLGEAEPVPIYRDGALEGIELRDVAPDGFYAGLGLRDGDLVQSINGIPLDAEEMPAQLLWSLSTTPNVELEVERIDGRQERISVPREEVIRRLESLGTGE